MVNATPPFLVAKCDLKTIRPEGAGAAFILCVMGYAVVEAEHFRACCQGVVSQPREKRKAAQIWCMRREFS